MSMAVAPLSESASQALDTWVSSNWMPPVPGKTGEVKEDGPRPARRHA